MDVTRSADPTPTPAPDAPRRLRGAPNRLTEHAVWLLPALLTLLVAQFRATQAQPWRDELATWSAASRSLDDLVRMVVHIDAVSAPYYLLMHFWIAAFGDSVLALRAPSILCMTAAAAVTAILGRRLFGPRAGLLAGLLFALAPSTSRYAQEARAYALATLLATLATLLLVRALDRPGWRRWIGYGTCVAALGLAHLVAVTLVAGHLVAVLLAWRGGDRKALRWMAAAGAAGLVLLPLLWLGHGQQSTQLGWATKPTVREVTELPGSVLQSHAVGGAIAALAALGWATRARWGPALGLSAVLPAVLLLVGGLVSPLWVPRYLTFTVPLLCVLAGAAIATLRTTAALSIVALVAVLGAPDQSGFRKTHEWPRNARVDYAAAARVIGDHERTGDVIVYSPRTGWGLLDIATAYHLRERAPRDVLLAQNQTGRASLWATECPQPGQCLSGSDRVWVLARGSKRDPLTGMPAAKADALRADFRVSRVWHVSGLTVALLTRAGR